MICIEQAGSNDLVNKLDELSSPYLTLKKLETFHQHKTSHLTLPPPTMGRFYPLYVRRSDGKTEIVSKGQRKKEANQPTEEQLDQRPDRNGTSDFYREVAPDEPKHLDWRRKIGGMLARELNSTHKAGVDGYILATFPENYRLYEHVKKTVVDGKTEVKSKTHGAGGNDRQDAYLYGHPLGRRKRFRSPGDFFAHVLWLATDESGDADNCTCKICSPEDLENLIPSASVQVKKQPVAGQNTSMAAAARPTSSSGVKPKTEPSTTSSTTMTPIPPRSSALTPTPLPQRKNPDHFYDAQYRSFMYRPGELIWFQRGQAWGLGIIVRRWGNPQTPNDRHYLVQPLSHPPIPARPNYPATTIKSSEMEMRPWIAWSVPLFTNDGLNKLNPPARFENIDWQAVQDHKFGNGDIEVDGSILAAKMIDSSYTPFNKLRSATNPQAGLTETHYEGIFLGAEKIWIGDPIRLRLEIGTEIMVVNSIIERTTASSNSNESQLIFQGDVYTLQQISHSNPSLETPASTQNNPHLPVRLTQDLAFRNARSIPRKHIASYWKLATANTRFPINDVKGRWYEASLILPILQPAAFADAERKGEIQEASLWMNSRGDCRGKGEARSNVRKGRREEGFAGAVPRGLRVLEGLVPPGGDEVKGEAIVVKDEEEMNIDPRFDTADGNGGGDGEAKGQFDELMNFDGGEAGAAGGGFDQGGAFGGSHGGGGHQPAYF